MVNSESKWFNDGPRAGILRLVSDGVRAPGRALPAFPHTDRSVPGRRRSPAPDPLVRMGFDVGTVPVATLSTIVCLGPTKTRVAEKAAETWISHAPMPTHI